LTDERVERRLAAVLAADVAGYSRLMGGDEEGTLARLKATRKDLFDPAIASHRGRIVKTTGDGALVEFASAVDAVRGAVEVQRAMAEQNAFLPKHQRIEFRIGIHVGDIIFDENDIFGDGVNVAARVENECEPGGVYLSDDAFRQVRGKMPFAFEDMGERALKNIALPVRLYAVRSPADAQPEPPAGPPASAGIDLASIGLILPENVTLKDEIVVQSLAIVFLNLANSAGKGTLFRRSWTAFPNGGPGKRRFSYHQYFVAIENKSSTKTLRGVRLVAEFISSPLGQVLNREFPCERTGTGSADIPPKGKDYYLIGEGIDDSDVGIFNMKVVAADEYDRILADIDHREQRGIGFTLSTSRGQTYSLLKNDGNKLTIRAYADDNAPATGALVINARNRIQVWLTEDIDD
jgi:class 3 adenylate cyclase